MAGRRGTCVYCGRQCRITEDHIPPQALWAKPKPRDLIVVPSCVACNEGASKDDEYFKTVLILKDRAGSHPEAAAVRDSVFRALAMPKKARFARRLVSGIREVNVRTPAGLHVRRGAAFDVDLSRLDRVVARVTRGLYWHHHDHTRLPDDYAVGVWSEEGLSGIGPTEAEELRRNLVDPVLKNPKHSIGRNVLGYWLAPGDREHVTGWLLEFYEDVRFVAFTIPKETGA